jgi:hypothetical protein
MNYTKHYEMLIERAKNRIIDGYVERHHIIPKTLGGSNEDINLVDLTAREHFIAHQLLVKIYPNNIGLIKAVQIMCIMSNGQSERVNNRMYGWLKEKFALAQSISQFGEKNSQYGTMWVSNLSQRISKKIPKGEIPNGWVKGRNVWLSLEKKEKYKLEIEIKKLKYNQDKKDELRPILIDYKKYGFEYVHRKYNLMIKHSAFTLKLKKYFPNEMKIESPINREFICKCCDKVFVKKAKENKKFIYCSRYCAGKDGSNVFRGNQYVNKTK